MADDWQLAALENLWREVAADAELPSGHVEWFARAIDVLGFEGAQYAVTATARKSLPEHPRRLYSAFMRAKYFNGVVRGMAISVDECCAAVAHVAWYWRCHGIDRLEAAAGNTTLYKDARARSESQSQPVNAEGRGSRR